MTEPEAKKPRRRRRRHRGPSDDGAIGGRWITTAQNVRADTVQQAMTAAFDDTKNTGLPHLFVLTGETGRGKTYAIQSFYDKLAAVYPGYWQPGLRPTWPPTSTNELRRERKRVTPPPELRSKGARAPFLWLSVSCSGSPDAPRLDPTAHLLRQLQIAIGDAVETELARSETVHWIADRVVEGVGQFQPVVSLLKYLADTAKGALAMLDARKPSALLSERSQAFDTLRRYAEIARRLELDLPPVVVVIDDASAADEELLSSISALIADPSIEEVAHGRMLPSSIGQFPPLPVFVVATAWDHAISAEGYATTFDRWLSEFDDLGLTATRVTCREFARTEAIGVLNDWPFGPDPRFREAIIDHIANGDVDGLVNPLVLAEHVAWVELQRDPFQAKIAVDVSEIEALSTSPYQQIEERLDDLNRGSVGRESYAVLRLVCEVAITFPFGLISQLHAASTATSSIVEICDHLIAHRMILVPADVETSLEPLQPITIDADIYDYLLRRSGPKPSTAILSQSAERLLAVWANAEKDGLLRGMRLPAPQRLALMLPIAHVASEAPQIAAESGLLMGAAQLEEPLDFDSWTACPDSATKALSWLISGATAQVDASMLAVGIQSLGVSSAAADCVKAMLAGEVRPDPQQLELLIDVFAPHADLVDIQVPLVRLFMAAGRGADASRLLPADDFEPQAALEVSAVLSKLDSDAAAAEFLRGRSSSNGTIRRRLAELVASSEGPEPALEILDMESGSWVEASYYCELLEKANRLEERRETLIALARRNAFAAVLLGSEYENEGDIVKARAALTPWAASNVNAAQRLALLEWAAGNHVAALTTLVPFGLQNRNVVPALSRMLDSIAVEGIRFRQGRDGHLEASPPGTRTTETSIGPAAGWATPAAISSLLRASPLDASAEDVSRELTVRFGQNFPTRQAVRAVLLPPFGGSPRNSAIAFHYFAQAVSESEGLTCSVADLAFAAHFEDAPVRATSIIEAHAQSRTPSIVGRRAATKILVGDAEDSVQRLLNLAPEDLWFAMVGAMKMVAAMPAMEELLWGRLSAEVHRIRGGEPHPAVCAFIGGRFLVLERDSSESKTDRASRVQQLIRGISSDDVTRTLTAILEQATADESGAGSLILPYQLLSQYEVLEALDRANPALASALAAQIATRPDAQQMKGWAKQSSIARLMVADSKA